MRARTSTGNTPSGSTSRSKRDANARRAGAVALVASGVFAQREYAAMRARVRRLLGVLGAAMNPTFRRVHIR
jgi:hypothetical protein